MTTQTTLRVVLGNELFNCSGTQDFVEGCLDVWIAGLNNLYLPKEELNETGI